MIKKILRTMTQKPDKSNTDFFKLSAGKQKDIIKKAIRISSEEQRDLLKEYERKFSR